MGRTEQPSRRSRTQKNIKVKMISFTASLLVLNSLVDSLPIGSKTWMQEDLLWIEDVMLERLGRIGSGRNAIKDKEKRCESGVIPYSFSFSSEGRKVVDEGMKEFESKTCIKFKPRSSERNYIQIYSGSGSRRWEEWGGCRA